ncbi:MAG: EVE domain-containing protein [Gammaproteobacteria bacterium]|nr:EVE domain-containing protein [Gammaproteobacteria bacterium]
MSAGARSYWLLKSEPQAFSIDDLARRPAQTEAWDGVRNYQARNFLRDEMRPKDQAFFYHSSCAQPAIVGIVEILAPARPDPTQFDPSDPHYDPRAHRQTPRWWLVDVRLVRRLRRPIELAELRRHADRLAGLALLARGSRLSVMPVTPQHWHFILALRPPPG